MNALLKKTWDHRMLWLPPLLLVLVLAVTFLLLPASKAPFIYQYF